MENYIDDSRIHEGHRQRMRAKLLNHGQRIFDTYELLEMLLYHVIPYRDTNPVSKRLLYALGGLDGVLTADKEKLTAISGVGERTAEFIRSAGKLSSILGSEFVPSQNLYYGNFDVVGKYLTDYFKNENETCVIAMMLDNNMRLIETKKLYSLDYESAGVRPKAFVDAAISSRASVVISAHNHIHGPFCPTQGDRATHNAISVSLSAAGVFHAEHYVVCGDSYSAIGTLTGFSGKLLQSSGVSEFMASIPEEQDNEELSEKEAFPPANARYDTHNFDYFASLLSVVGSKDARANAHTLLSKFLTIENVLSASEAELITMCSEKVAFLIKVLAYVTSRRLTDKFAFGKAYTSGEIADYLKALFVGDSVEKIYILSYDNQNKFIGCDLLSEGTVNASEIIPRKAIEAAIIKRASSVIIAHNHPLGRAEPSPEDMKFTNLLFSLFSNCDIKLTAHYVIAGQLCNVITIGF